MQFSVGIEYAFHSLFYLIEIPERTTVGIKQIADLNGLTESYLSKIFTKLRKAGIVRSVPGVKGGYELARSADAISFWDVIEAIEGPSYFFQCAEIRRQNIFNVPTASADPCPCLIKVVIHEAEDKLRESLRARSLQWLYEQVSSNFSSEKKSAISAWINAL